VVEEEIVKSLTLLDIFYLIKTKLLFQLF